MALLSRTLLLAALALPLLAGAAPAAQTPGASGLNSPPELQNALKERNLQAPGKLSGQNYPRTPGKLTGQGSPRTLGKLPPRGQAKVPGKTGPAGQETPQSFRERYRLHPGAAGGQASRDVFLNQRIQGQSPSSLQRRPTPPKEPAKEQPLAAPEAQPLLELTPAPPQASPR